MDNSGKSPGRVLLVRSGQLHWALPLERVVQVGELGRLSRLPHAPRAWCGATSFHGRVVPVLDLARLNDMDDEAAMAIALVLISGQPIGLRLAEIVGVRLATECDTRILDLDEIDLPVVASRHTRSDPDGRHQQTLPAQTQERGLTMMIGGQAYWLPLTDLVELVETAVTVDVPWADPRTPAVLIDGNEALAVVRLDLLLGRAVASDGPLVVARAASGKIAFRVDEMMGVGDRGMTQALALAELLAQIPGNDLEAPQPAAEPARAAEEAWLAIVLEHQLCLLPLKQIRLVATGARPASLPAPKGRARGGPKGAAAGASGMAPGLVGVRAIGGRILPVVDQRRSLGLTALEPTAVDIVVAPLDAPHFILAVQQIDGIVRVRPDEIRATGGGTMINGVSRLGDRLAWLLSPSGLAPVAADEREARGAKTR